MLHVADRAIQQRTDITKCVINSQLEENGGERLDQENNHIRTYYYSHTVYQLIIMTNLKQLQNFSGKKPHKRLDRVFVKNSTYLSARENCAPLATNREVSNTPIKFTQSF